MKRWQQRTSWPTHGWEEAAPEACGMNSDLLSQLDTFIQEQELPLYAMLIVRHGSLGKDEKVQLPKEFFHLQLQFAKRIAHILHILLADALIEYSTLYMSFGLGRSFDPTHPTWQEYLAGLKSISNDVEWTYAFYMNHYIESYQENSFGCFNYAYIPDNKTVRLHFANQDASGYSPLSRDRIETRLQELAALFTDVLRLHPEAEVVRGRSWLYNIEAYRRLFPSEYTQKAEVAIEGEFPFMALWGQFLNRHEQLHEPMAQNFLNCVAEQETLAGIKRCFPYLPLAPQYSIHHFYTFYKIN